ncbi:PPK2 family polyphosphate kinase [Herbiconiux sp. VKM Ac-2851]|jgi:PPK2 family polyphosphate:nucleotide phosphotransferase|uniref:PPK2 family polyphosphate kinase n=1 Tax=Herbiconiux sp. VKM Ac-2851 TaxID=2739025 RepID=UPI001564F73F|nr:PPK2 family polyphosphate kinase [Herbiconiux sp. VKM Ac-2851]NQX35912.1 polyphosphate kinase 2 family protein [Herbiconiux sp. VKM Ac-2851]
MPAHAEPPRGRIEGPWSSRLRAGAPGASVDLGEFDTGATPGVLDKDDGEASFRGTGKSLARMQEQLFAASTVSGGATARSVLLVLQGMDTSGKGGVVKKVAGSVDPQGVSHHAFKAPTEEERAHPFLWRVERQLPAPGQIGVWDRSHYEDVLVPRVRGTLSTAAIDDRYATINAFERQLVEAGTTIVKVFLHLGYEEQRKRLLRRLDRPDKHWKFSPGDVDDRAHWPAFQEAYEAALSATNTEPAPWFVVPADHKWFSALAVQQLLEEALTGLQLGWPAASFDVERERERLLAT